MDTVHYSSTNIVRIDDDSDISRRPSHSVCIPCCQRGPDSRDGAARHPRYLVGVPGAGVHGRLGTLLPQRVGPTIASLISVYINPKAKTTPACNPLGVEATVRWLVRDNITLFRRTGYRYMDHQRVQCYTEKRSWTIVSNIGRSTPGMPFVASAVQPIP